MLNLREGQTFLDGTVGGGGHSALASTILGPKGLVIGLDRDGAAILRAGERLRTLPARVELRQESFRNLDQVLRELGRASVDAILLDLGLSSDQFDESGRGFSFRYDEPLDMRMSGSGLTAGDILTAWDEETLGLIFRGFGEERYARRIAKEIVLRRQLKPFRTTFDLLDAVRAATPSRYHAGRIHFATRVFQALRIAVNEELQALEAALPKALEALPAGGRLAVITFHSLEDRIVKNFFRDQARGGEALLLTKKPVTASETEVEKNPRSRSAKLRAIEKIVN